MNQENESLEDTFVKISSNLIEAHVALVMIMVKKLITDNNEGLTDDEPEDTEM